MENQYCEIQDPPVYTEVIRRWNNETEASGSAMGADLEKLANNDAYLKRETERLDGTKVSVSEKGIRGGVASLDTEGKLEQHIEYEKVDNIPAQSWENLVDKPSSFPASAHTHTKAEVGLGNVDNTADAAKSVSYAASAGNADTVDGKHAAAFANASHTHPKSQITDFPAALKNPAALTLKMNGTSQGAYDGSAAKEINITASGIGAAASSHTHSYSTATNVKNGSGDGSVQEGTSTATGPSSHAEGILCKASGRNSHAEGQFSEALGDHSHAEGDQNITSGKNSHAEGSLCKASGISSHAEGHYNEASGSFSHAGGSYNYALGDSQTVVGRGNVKKGEQDTFESAFIVGTGHYDTCKNMFRVSVSGVYGAAAYTSSGADYAEYFEWEDGNPRKEDRVGHFVTLSDDKIKIANEGDYILGIISGTASVIGNGYEDQWIGMELRDEWGRLIWEEYAEPAEYKEIEQEDGTIEKVLIKPKSSGMRPKLNSDYDKTQPYLERSKRPEWSPVGMLGVLRVRDDGSCKVNGYCTVADGGIATAASDGYRVIGRVTDNIIKIIFR